MEVNRPQTKLQSSRKGKKAWRKNVDLDDIQIALEENREREINLGTNEFEDDNNDNDFIIDDKGDSKIENKYETKKLKSHEILSNKSKVKSLIIERNNKKIQGILKNKVHKLMKLSGKVNPESKLHARVEKDGIIRASKLDPWAIDEEEQKLNDAKPEILKNFASHEITKPTHGPNTLKRDTIKLWGRDNEHSNNIDAGKSYNPSLESWKSLIDKEFNIENEKELKRIEIREYNEKIQELIRNSNENEVNEESSDDEDDNEEIKEEINEEEMNEEDKYKISINKPTEVKIKTKAKRNREEKHKKRLELESTVAKLKEQLKELTKLDDYNKEVELKQFKANSHKGSINKKSRKLFKHSTVNKPLEIKLSDELTQNLKNLKPEGNLFYDQMRNLQTSGKIETRVPVARRRKYAPKITEKWTYKDFK